MDTSQILDIIASFAAVTGFVIVSKNRERRPDLGGVGGLPKSTYLPARIGFCDPSGCLVSVYSMRWPSGCQRLNTLTFDNRIYLTGQPGDVLPPALSLAERGGNYEYI